MSENNQVTRRTAIDQAIASSGFSCFEPTEFGLSVYEKWIIGQLSVNDAVALLIQYHKELEIQAESSDHQAAPNKLTITDSIRLKQAESDIVTLRMACLDIADQS
jgi:hypothetical protein